MRNPPDCEFSLHGLSGTDRCVVELAVRHMAKPSTHHRPVGSRYVHNARQEQCPNIKQHGSGRADERAFDERRNFNHGVSFLQEWHGLIGLLLQCSIDMRASTSASDQALLAGQFIRQGLDVVAFGTT